jgi:hypothetical protein
MGKLYTLARPGEDHFVLADDVPAAKRSEADIAAVPRANIALARPDTLVGEGDASGFSCGVAKEE